MGTSHITWDDLAQLKKAAKAAKASHPNLGHMQRLDALAAERFGVRHFHELQQRYESGVARHVDSDGGLHRCRFCSLEFDGTLASDVEEHLERHGRFEQAQLALGFVPLTYQQREQVKRTGYGLAHSADPGGQRQGALAVLLAHFERSLERAIVAGRWHRHPHFKAYVACALADASFLPEPVRQRLVTEFGVRPGAFPVGGTDWPAQAAIQPDRSPAEVAASGQLRGTVLHAMQSAVEAATTD